jgi:hypothetical protein
MLRYVEFCKPCKIVARQESFADHGFSPIFIEKCNNWYFVKSMSKHRLEGITIVGLVSQLGYT